MNLNKHFYTLEHFNYIKNLIGVDYIGIGAAYDDLTP